MLLLLLCPISAMQQCLCDVVVVVQDDVETLAEDPDQDAYEAMPVEMFGEAMLRGMGWSEGKGIGVNKVQAITASAAITKTTHFLRTCSDA